MIIFAIIDNVSAPSIRNINYQFFVLGCPFPVSNGIDHLFIYGSQIQYGNFTYPNGGNGFGTYYQCELQGTQQNPLNVIVITPKAYNATVAAFPSGWFVQAGDTISSVSQKLTALANILAYFLTPINFNFLGYTLTSLSGIALLLVVAIFVYAYLGIGLFLFSVLKPSGGGLPMIPV